MELIEVHLDRGQWKRARELINDASKEGGLEPGLIVLDAETSFSLGELEKAEAGYRKVLGAHPQDPRALAGLAKVAAVSGRMDEARSLVEQAVQTAPASRHALQTRANLLAQQQNYRGAASDYEKVLEINLYNPSAHEGLISAHLGLGDVDKAEAALGRYNKTGLGRGGVIYLGALVAHARGDLSRARDLLKELLKSSPDSEEANLLAGTIEHDAGNFTGAERHLRKVLAVKTDAVPANVLLALGLARAGRLDEAKGHIQKLLKSYPNVPPYLAAAGQIYLTSGEPGKGLIFLEQAAKTAPPDSPLLVQLGQARLATGDVQGGLSILQRALEPEIPSTSAFLTLVEHFVRKQDLKSSSDLVEKYVNKRPQDPLGYEMRAFIELARRNRDSARTALNKASELAPESYRVLRQHVLMDLEANEADAAIKRLQEFLSRNPRNPEGILLLAQLVDGKAPGGPEAQKVLDAGIAANPASSRLWREKVERLLRKKDFEGARDAAKQAAAALPDDPTAAELEARVQLAQGDLTSAAYGYEKLAATPNAEIGGALGVAEIHVQRREWSKARDAVKRAIAKHPNDLTLHAVLLDISQKSGDEGAALKDAETIAAKWPSEPFGHLAAGRLLTAANRQAEAEQAFRRGLAKTDNAAVLAELYGLLDRRGAVQAAEKEAAQWLGRHPNTPSIWAFVGDARVRRGDLAGAEEMFRKLVASQPTQIQALDRLARVLAKRDSREALDVAAKMVQLAPESAVALSSAGAVYLKFDRTSESVDLLKKAVAKMPSSAVVRLRYAEALKKTGDGAGAKQQITEALALNPAGELRTALVDLQKSL